MYRLYYKLGHSRSKRHHITVNKYTSLQEYGITVRDLSKDRLNNIIYTQTTDNILDLLKFVTRIKDPEDFETISFQVYKFIKTSTLRHDIPAEIEPYFEHYQLPIPQLDKKEYNKECLSVWLSKEFSGLYS